MRESELVSVLKDNNTILGEYITLLKGLNVEAPVKVYENNLRLINELTEPKDKQQPIQKETTCKSASVLLLENKVLVEAQVRHPNNKYFLNECDTFIKDYGEKRFLKVIERTLRAKSKTKIKNIYSYIHQALINEMKLGLN